MGIFGEFLCFAEKRSRENATLSTEMVRTKPEITIVGAEPMKKTERWKLAEGFLGRFWAVP